MYAQFDFNLPGCLRFSIDYSHMKNEDNGWSYIFNTAFATGITLFPCLICSKSVCATDLSHMVRAEDCIRLVFPDCDAKSGFMYPNSWIFGWPRIIGLILTIAPNAKFYLRLALPFILYIVRFLCVYAYCMILLPTWPFRFSSPETWYFNLPVRIREAIWWVSGNKSTFFYRRILLTRVRAYFRLTFFQAPRWLWTVIALQTPRKWIIARSPLTGCVKIEGLELLIWEHLCNYLISSSWTWPYLTWV